MKDPAFLFYPSDWLSGTLGMTFEEKGAYLELLLVQFNQGHMTDHIVQRIVGELWQSIRHKFKQDENGLWYNIRLEQEQTKRSKFTESRRKNISKRYEATYVGTKTLHMENENENRNRNRNRNRNEIRNRNEKIKESEKQKFELPHKSESFVKLWDELLQQKKWSNKSASAISMNLKKLAAMDERTAIVSLENAIGGEWQGIYPPSDTKHQPNKNNGSNAKFNGIDYTQPL